MPPRPLLDHHGPGLEGGNREGEIPAIGSGVAILSHYFKIVIWQVADTVDGFVSVMENRDYELGENYRDFVRSIQWLDEVLDIQFLPDLPKPVAEALKNEPGVPLEWTRADCPTLCGSEANC